MRLLRSSAFVLLGFVLSVMLAGTIGFAQAKLAKNGWDPDLLAELRQIRNPLPATPAVLNTGKMIYVARCQHCHGAEGKGDGPDAEPDNLLIDLTAADRASINPDGVVFNKVWNGPHYHRWRQGMPGFSKTLSMNDGWAVVAYVQTFRKPS